MDEFEYSEYGEDATPDYEVWERNQLDRDMAAEREDEMQQRVTDWVDENPDGTFTFRGAGRNFESFASAEAAAYHYLYGDVEDDIDDHFDAGAEEQQRIEAEMGEPRHDDIEEW